MLKPWITSTLENRIKIKDKFGLLSKKGRVDRKVYTDFRNLVDKQVKKAKSVYHNKKLKNSNGNMKKTWDIINKSKKKKEN